MKSANLAIVFVDIAGYTERTGQQSRSESAAWLQRFEQLIMPLVRAFSGKRIKTIGDAYLCTFPSPTNALLFGMAAQDRLFIHNRDVAEQERFQIRVAVNTGEVRLQRGDVFGEPVNVAARVEGLTPAGEIWFTEAVHLSMTRSEVPAEELGSRQLKGIVQPVRLYRVPPDHGYRLEPEEVFNGQAGGLQGPEVDRFPFGGIGLRRAEQSGWASGLGAAPERFAQAGRGLAASIWSWIGLVPRWIWFGLLGLLGLSILIAGLLAARPFAEIRDALADGQPSRAQVLLDGHADKDTPAGRALQARIWLRHADPATAKAASLLHTAVGEDGGLLADDEVVRDLVQTLARRHAKETIDLLVERVGARAVDALVDGSQDKRYWVRWNSVKALQSLGEADEVDLVQLYIQDLDNTGRCSTRKAAAVKLAELKDDRALEPLRRAQQRNFIDNLCMGDTLGWAIRKIEAD